MHAETLWSVVGGGVALFAVAVACGPNAAAPRSVAIGVGNTGGSSGTNTVKSVGIAGVTTLAAPIFMPQGIALGPSEVYWTSTGTLVADGGGPVDAGTFPSGGGPGGIGQASRAGGQTFTFIVEDLAAPTTLLYDSNRLFWAEGLGSGASIGSLDIATSTETTVEKTQQLPLALTTNGTGIVWTSGSGSGFDVKALSSSGATRSLGATTSDDSALGVTVDGSTVFVAVSVSGLSGAVFSLPLGGGTPRSLWTGGSGPAADIATLTGRIYWTVDAASGQGAILSMPTSGGLVTTLAAGQNNPQHLVINDDTLYFTSNTADGAVLSLPTTGGTLTTLASGLDYPSALAVDDAVYFTTNTAILRVAK